MMTNAAGAVSVPACAPAEPYGSDRERPSMSDTKVTVEVFDVPAQTACYSGG